MDQCDRAAAQTTPQRILIAGCGTGVEAFAFRRRFPKAEIVGVDFAASSIRVAKRLLQRAADTRSIHFIHADLTNEKLVRITGGDFDFISCHGVMSYLPRPERALRNLTRCLSPHGILYLGVNGRTHFSQSWRKFLSAFGFEMARWPGGERLWRHLRFTAALAGDESHQTLSHGAGYLASDLFGSLIRNASLADWVRICNRVGLHFRGSAGIQRLLWPAINDGLGELFLPRSRAEVALLLDGLHPGAFHRLIFTRQPEVAPPWQKSNELINWRPLRTNHFRHFKWPRRRGARVFKLENKRANIAIELRGAGWEIDLLRQSNGECSLREILAPLTSAPSPVALRSQLYLFYLLDLLNLLPPDPPNQEREKVRSRADR